MELPVLSAPSEGATIYCHVEEEDESTQGTSKTRRANITETPPDVVEVVEPDHNALEDHLQVRTEKDVEVFVQVRLNIDKLQEKQKESYRSRIKKGTKCFDIQANYLVWKKDERKARPGKPHCSLAPSWGHHLLRTIDCPNPQEVSHPPEPVSSDQSDYLCSES
ncbi:hypothetical protein J4Q44_G00308120 [Coregonus suidteri]|uniref:Uncharacterized protein n=1 Tax=Coregonus suidteri TaxID=861788 RepID=A0AAN8QRM2_9TELE